jgi:NADH:ubiquinone oxidoreductase subunit 6 (subunit J)
MSVLLAKNLKYSVFCLLLVLCRIAAYIRLLNAVER